MSDVTVAQLKGQVEMLRMMLGSVLTFVPIDTIDSVGPTLRLQWIEMVMRGLSLDHEMAFDSRWIDLMTRVEDLRDQLEEAKEDIK